LRLPRRRLFAWSVRFQQMSNRRWQRRPGRRRFLEFGEGGRAQNRGLFVEDLLGRRHERCCRRRCRTNRFGVLGSTSLIALRCEPCAKGRQCRLSRGCPRERRRRGGSIGGGSRILRLFPSYRFRCLDFARLRRSRSIRSSEQRTLVGLQELVGHHPHWDRGLTRTHFRCVWRRRRGRRYRRWFWACGSARRETR
jgi:hypothetical protein